MRDRGLLSSGLVLLVLSIAACQGEERETSKAEAPQATAVVGATIVPEQTATATTAPEPTATETSVPEPTATETTAPEPTATAEPSAPEAKEGSPEELELIGIVRGGSTPSALIGFGVRQEIFRKGDSVFDHGTVKEVRDDSIVISSGGNDVTLKLAKEPTPAPPPAPAEEVEAMAAAKVVVPPRAAEPLSRTETRAALRNLAPLLEKADARRVAVGGGHGLQLGTVDGTSFFAKLGLQSGDILLKLNGAALDDPEHLPDLSSAAEGKELAVSYSRNDVALTVARPLQ